MNSFNTLKLSFVILLLTLMNSCSKSSDNEPTNLGTGDLSSISITTSSTSLVLEDQDYFTIHVLGNDNVNYSSSSTIYVNGVAIPTNAYTPVEVGTLEVYAKKNDLISNTVSIEVISGVDGVNINLSETSVKVNNIIEFSAKDNYNNDVTSESVFYVDGLAITGSTYSADIYGDHEVYAIYSSSNGALQSPSTSFNVYRFTQKVLVEDYTGTWCGYCPRLAYNLEQAEQEDDAVIGVGIHDDNDMQYEFVGQMETQYNITGFPSGRINRNFVWNESVSQILAFLGSNPGLGLAINSSLVGNSISVEVKIGYDISSSNNKVVIYLIEDGLIYPQSNYYNGDPSSPWYQTGDPIVNFEHNNVLRKAFTNIFGDSIPNAMVGDEHIVNYDVAVPGSVQNTSNLEIVAFVLNTNTGYVVNVQHAPLGAQQDYD